MFIDESDTVYDRESRRDTTAEWLKVWSKSYSRLCSTALYVSPIIHVYYTHY